ncbi:hypothetical protein [Frigoriglobus tundricola]|uniref:Uncharacterized protein n=1 Tax=Frigoriglobus tundricola TaxID=2774151 RepID=A0A6M5YMA2_9BACT|nr:hypothetical protein [Frigoriglobus tundricola]QJW94072.1 hypothetical protein FTUN_1591 [Frigoriglobus tundricola]
MELSVLVQQTGNDRFRAWCDSPIAASAEGTTRDEALANLRTEIGTKTRGVEVVRLAIPNGSADDPLGTVGDEQSNDPESIAAWIAAFDAIPPLQMTADEEAVWMTERRARSHRDAGAIDRFASELPGATE